MTTRASGKVIAVNGRPMPPGVVRALIGHGVDGSAYDDALDRLAGVLRDGGYSVELLEACDTRAARPGSDQAELLLQAIGEGVCLADREGAVLWSNDFYASIDEASRADIGVCLREARDWFDQHSTRRRAKSRAFGGMNGGGTGGGSGAGFGSGRDTSPGVCRFEVEVSESDVVYELEITPADVHQGEDGEKGGDGGDGAGDRSGEVGAGLVQRMAVVVRDITASRRTMRKLDAIDKAGIELVRLDANAVRERNTYQRLELMEEKIVRLMHDVLNYDHFAIFLIDESRQKLELVISAGLPDEIHDLDLSPEHEGSGISGMVAATGKTYVCRDAASDERFIPGLSGARSSCTVPLQMHDRVIGIMDVESQSANVFTDSERQFLEIFARYIAIALHMLDLLVVERSATNLSVSGRVGGELEEPLADIVKEIDALSGTMIDPTKAGHLSRIREDVDAIRSRIANVAQGPQTLLGVDRALSDKKDDPVLKGKRALVADDEHKICKVIGAVLRSRGCAADVVMDGQSAIDALKRVAADGDEAKYDIVISDIRMPNRNGYEVFSAAKSLDDSIPVILMTGFGYDPHHSIVRASQEGMSGVLFKPFDIEQLIEAMHDAMAETE